MIDIESLRKIAQDAALTGGIEGEHDYLPKTPLDARIWEPHAWVIRAMRNALVADGSVVVTKNAAGVIVAVTRQDDEGRILRIISEPGLSPKPEHPNLKESNHG